MYCDIRNAKYSCSAASGMPSFCSRSALINAPKCEMYSLALVGDWKILQTERKLLRPFVGQIETGNLSLGSEHIETTQMTFCSSAWNLGIISSTSVASIT